MVVRMKSAGLVAHLRSWGLAVSEKDGWRSRGRNYDFYPRGIMVHHTASSRRGGNFASEGVVTYGRSDLPGPLCQFLLGRNGEVKIIAAGLCNHAGYGGPKAGVPKDQGNTYFIGIEAENDGVGEPWSDKQMQAYYRLCAALMRWINIDDVSLVIGHKEWAPGRKSDPNFDMNAFRRNVRASLAKGPSRPKVTLSNVKPGKSNSDVLKVKKALAKKGYKGLNLKSQKFGIGLRRAYKKFQKSLGYTGNDANGIPGKVSLEKLGFSVLD